MNLTGLHFTSTNLPDKEICFWRTFGKRVLFHCWSLNILQDNGNFCSSCLHCGKCHHTLFLYFSLELEIYLGIDVHLKLLKTIGHNSYATANIPTLYFLNQQILTSKQNIPWVGLCGFESVGGAGAVPKILMNVECI